MSRPEAATNRGAGFAVNLQPPLSARPKERLRSFALSLVLHVALVTTLVSLDVPGQSARFEPLTAEELLAAKQFRITLYTPREQLPAVAPSNQPAQREGAKRALLRFRQKIVADDPDPRSLRQKILGLAPDIEIEQDIRSPNLLAWNSPKVSRPRFQMEQRRETTPQRQALRAAAAPEIEVARPVALNLPAAAEPRLRFRQRKKEESTPARRAIAPETAPELQGAASKLDWATLHSPTRQRYWTPEAGPRTDPERKAIQGDAAPEIGVGQQAIDLGAIQKNPRLRYWTSGTNRVAPGRKAIALANAPAIEAQAPGAARLGTLRNQARLRYHNWDYRPAAPTRGAAAPGVGALGVAAPEIKGSDGFGGSEPGSGVAALVARESLADAVRAGYANGVSVPAGAAGGGPVEGPGGDGPSALVVGLDADPTAVEAIPLGSRRGRFSASPDGGPGGGDLMIASAGGASLRAPNLSIDGRASAARDAAVQRERQERPSPLGPGISPRPSRTDEASVLSLFQRRGNVRDIGAPPLIDPNIDVRSKRPEMLFLDREVFVLAVNTPNVTSYSGSWIIRFAERLQGMRRRDKTIDSNEKEDPSQGRLSAPGPKHKVDPKYIRTAADEGVEGTVTLYAVIQMDGTVREIEVVRSVDPRLDESAIAALAQWQFHPATRLGVPVEVDVLIDIPFRLAPPEEREKRVIQSF